MDDRQRAKLNMYIVVGGFLEDNQPVWSTIPKFVSSETAFRGELTNLESLSQAQQQPTTGVTAGKKQLKTAMGAAAMPVVGGLQALAGDLPDPDLAAQAAFSLTDFVYEPDTEAADNADIVHALAAGHAELADCGLTQAAIDALDTAILAFRAKIGAPRLVTVGTSTATTQIAQAIKTIDGLLDKMDNLTEVLKPGNATFYTSYHAAREIIDPGTGGSPPPPPSPPPPSPPPP